MTNITTFLCSGTYTAGGGSVQLFYRAQYIADDNLLGATTVQVGQVNQVGIPFNVTHNYNGVPQAIPNAKVFVTQDNIMVDIAITSASGTCALFLASGTYDVGIRSDVVNGDYNFYNVASGIQATYAQVATGQLVNTYGDVYDYGNNIYEISGVIVDDNNNPWENAEIILSQGENLVTDYFTDQGGTYHFVVPTGTYDVRLRAEDKNVKIYLGFNFTGPQGFMSQLANLDVNFGVGGDWKWISN